MNEKFQKLVDIIYGNYNENLSKLSEVLISINPDAIEYAEKVQEIMTKHLSFDLLKPKLIKLYERFLTEDDASVIINFYLSDAGEKLLKYQLELATEVTKLNQSILQEKQELIKKELDEWIENESKKKQQLNN